MKSKSIEDKSLDLVDKLMENHALIFRHLFSLLKEDWIIINYN